MLKTRGEAESFYTSAWKYTTATFLNSFKISDIDQLILALIFRFGVIWPKKSNVKFSLVIYVIKDIH